MKGDIILTNNECMEKHFNVQAYLERISYKGPLDGSVQALSDIQEAHVHTVPYENLDILYGKKLSLEIPDLYEKIVRKSRGGYCFELNGLFGWLLRELSYPVTDFFARFLRDETTIPMRRHRVLKVIVQGEAYLCDVGVGGPAPARPIRMVEGLEQKQGNECYRLKRDPELGWVLEEIRHGEWSRLYSFTEETQLPIDFIMPTFYCENAPDSIFKKEAMVSMRTPEGRVTVAGDEFRIFTPEGVETFVPETEQAYHEALKKYFGIIVE